MSIRLACGIVTDIGFLFTEPIISSLQKLIPLLRNILSNNHVTLECKLRAITTLGEICLPAEAQIIPYMGDIMQSISQACGMSLNIGEDEDEIKNYASLR